MPKGKGRNVVSRGSIPPPPSYQRSQIAMQEGAVPSVPSSRVVGIAFVEQYYNILHQSPGLVHRFYQGSSLLSRPDNSGNMTTVTTTQAINEKILSLKYEEFTAEIKTMDAQESYGRGVVVVVTGCLTAKDAVRRNFTQTFFLAPQENGYFVLNDVFRYIKESALALPTSAPADRLSTAATSAVALPPEPEPVSAPDHHPEEPETSLSAPEFFDHSRNEGSVVEEAVRPPIHPVDVAPVAEDDVPKELCPSILNVGQGSSMHSQSPCAGYSRQVRNCQEELYEKLKRAMTDTQKAKREAYKELVNRQKAEKDAIEAFQTAKLFESRYSLELLQKKELEEMLGKELEINEQKVQELIDKLAVTEVDLQKCKKDQEDSQILLDNMLKINDEILMNQAGGQQPLRPQRQQLLTEFSPSELKEATNNFDQALKIEDGDYWSSYKCILRNTQLTVKRLHLGSSQISSQYHLEVEVMNKLRHPNLVTLVGVCPDDCALIYEYLPNGSLENQLSSNSAILSWQTRIRISTEICSALIFLHSVEIVHGDLKSRNVLLDANFVSKLRDFGIHLRNSEELLSIESDVYSFGIILLQLLTGRSDQYLASQVQDALNKGNVSAIMDSTAGDWPFVEAMQLAELALNCCAADRFERPHLSLEVWSLLERMTTSSVASATPSNQRKNHPPEYFICPISQDIMEDPHVAADGFTYEAKAIRKWIKSGHDTSPMTNLKLLHDYLTPNLSLRSAIQEWRQNHH